MTGSLLARTLKQDRELRHDFEAFLKERRDDASHQLENAGADIAIFQAQGKIRALDDLKTMLEQMMGAPSEQNAVNERH